MLSEVFVIIIYVNKYAVTTCNKASCQTWWKKHDAMFPPIIFSPQRQFANVLYVKYADVIWMMGIKLFKCEVLIDILCLDCGFLNVRVNLFFTPS